MRVRPESQARTYRGLHGARRVRRTSAMDHGLNANLLRTWVTADKKRRASTEIVPVAKTLNPAAAAFIPVIPTQAQPKETAPRLEIRFPNGVKVEFDDARDDQLLSLLAALSALPCFDSTKA